ncbi:hypothetical protein BpHYR1_001752 [Brachionus plicatilis]|uniref:Uncharacterized protein n=1 Tax=Brachionus plicatilis TaxID=10195 RepID=A0A3M7SMD9_BRAPC|nr:hypothetical protein BpHYR1_001752 [Brachionus plicatilis]
METSRTSYIETKRRKTPESTDGTLTTKRSGIGRPESLSTPTSNQGRDWYYEPNRIENQSKGAALQELNELDPSRMKFGMEFRMMDWPLKKIQEVKVESRKRLAHRLDSDEDVPP